jgi:hypothetical protein
MNPAKILALTVMLASTTAADCGGDERRASRPPRQTIVAVDLSGSQTPATLHESRAFVEQTIADLSYGDRMVLMEMGREGVAVELKRIPGVVPDLRDTTFISSVDRAALTGKQKALRSLVPQVFDTSLIGKIPHTDIFATLYVAEQYVRGAEGRPTTIILLSDMLQSAGDIEMDGARRMPPANWIEAQQAARTIPDLRGVCIVVVGADASTAAGVAVKQFWSDYFRAAGATFQDRNYVLLSNAASGLGCDKPDATAPPTR